VLPVSGLTTVEIYNELGQRVKTLMNENLQAGQKYEVNFSASGLSSGIYYYSLQVGGRVKTKRMTLIK